MSRTRRYSPWIGPGVGRGAGPVAGSVEVLRPASGRGSSSPGIPFLARVTRRIAVRWGSPQIFHTLARGFPGAILSSCFNLSIHQEGHPVWRRVVVMGAPGRAWTRAVWRRAAPVTRDRGVTGRRLCRGERARSPAAPAASRARSSITWPVSGTGARGTGRGVGARPAAYETTRGGGDRRHRPPRRRSRGRADGPGLGRRHRPRGTPRRCSLRAGDGRGGDSAAAAVAGVRRTRGRQSTAGRAAGADSPVSDLAHAVVAGILGLELLAAHTSGDRDTPVRVPDQAAGGIALLDLLTRPRRAPS